MAAKHAIELDAGAKMRELHLRAQRAMETGFDPSRYVSLLCAALHLGLPGPECARTVRLSSRQQEIMAMESTLERLSLTRPTLPKPVEAVDSGLVPLTDEQEALVHSALSSGSPGEILASGTYKGAASCAHIAAGVRH